MYREVLKLKPKNEKRKLWHLNEFNTFQAQQISDIRYILLSTEVEKKKY